MKDKKIVIIGAGKISYSLTEALINSGYKITSIISRKKESARKLAIKFGIKTFSNKIDDFYAKDCLVFVCVPDNQIENAAIELSITNKSLKNNLYVHLSGALDSSVLYPLRKKGAKTASFHIMQTFPSRKPVPIKGCFAAIETNDKETEKFLFALAKKLLLKPFKLKTGEKVFYHIAGVFVSNFMVGNFYTAGKIFDMKSFNFVRLMETITKATFDNIKNDGAEKALSGPVERGDIKTITAHINALKKISSKRKSYTFLLNYLSQSINLLEIVKLKSGRLSPNHIAIKRLLKTELNNLTEALKA